MIDILQYLPPRTKKSPSGWFSFNAPCCIHNGETPDKKKRGGIILDGADWAYHCFNCNYKARFIYGQQLSLKARNLLKWMGVPYDTIQKINLESLRNKKIYDVARDRSEAGEELIVKNIFFPKVVLPSNFRKITNTDTWAIEYLVERGLDWREYPYKITPMEKGRNAARIILPYLYAGETVGWTSRYLDNNFPKYVNEHQQPGFLFGMDMQKKDWDYIIVVEGVFCAVSIKGVAVMHGEISEQQMALLRRQGKEVIVVPDQDKPGLVLVEQALEAGFSVSMPLWPIGVKDVNDAVKAYGRLGALFSIMAMKTSSKIKARIMINNMVARKKLK